MVRQFLRRVGLLTGVLTFVVALSYFPSTASAAGPRDDMGGGFTQTYGWGVPLGEVVVQHTNSRPSEMRGVGIFRLAPDFVRTEVYFNGPIPSYSFKYVTAAEAAGCSGTQMPGSRFLSINFYPNTFSNQGRVPPVGEVIVVEDDAGVAAMALVCDRAATGTYSYGLTEQTEVRTGEFTSVDPFGNQYSVIGIDFKDQFRP